MRRVPDVIDCWYDSGAMPFAQWGYPHKGQQKLAANFPADFISEALDQTRGWFYSQLAISTLLFGEGGAAVDSSHSATDWPHPFRNCIVLGLMLGEDGNKMSKQKRNYREPREIFDRYGADALRWYFFANQPPWTSIRYKEQAIKDSIPEFLLRLWNVYSFFVIYANIDGFDPSQRLSGHVDQLSPEALAKGAGRRPVKQRAELDRWVISELNSCAAVVVERMDAYDNYAACLAITDFVDGLSNWYVRRSRDRFWSSEKDSPDKLDAYWTLYECLVTVSKLIAPFTPFLAESLWSNLAGVFGSRALDSVHLCDYPLSDPEQIDSLLSVRMRLLREIASLGLRARMDNKLKVRQPLAKVEVILADSVHQSWLAAHDALLRDELNVKQVEYTQHGEEYIDYQVRPNFKLLGPKLGKRMPAVKQLLEKADGGALLAQLQANGHVELTVDGEAVRLESDVLEVRLQAKPGWAAAQGKGCVVVLSTELTPELVLEGIARDVVRLIQEQRKALGCEYTYRIEVGVETDSAELRKAIETNRDYIMGETLAVQLVLGPLPGVDPIELELGEARIKLYVRITTKTNKKE
jgi:isoleucyl-tRNA synthetase